VGGLREVEELWRFAGGFGSCRGVCCPAGVEWLGERAVRGLVLWWVLVWLLGLEALQRVINGHNKPGGMTLSILCCDVGLRDWCSFSPGSPVCSLYLY